MAVCDDIYELRFTKSFEDLGRFFGSSKPGTYAAAGSTSSKYASGFTPIEVEDLDVDPVEPPDIPKFEMAEVNEGTLP